VQWGFLGRQETVGPFFCAPAGRTLVRDLHFNRYIRPAAGLQEKAMIGWAVTFLIVALVAAVLGFTGIAGVATNIAWILFVVGLILAVVFALFGRRAV
jgi:uncharacterized membrane protein YtjA (UPF0391 family)